ALRDRSINEGMNISEFARTAVDATRRPTPRFFGLDVRDDIEAAFVRATKLDPRERWQTANEFWKSLTTAIKLGKLKDPLGRTMPLGSNFQLPPRAEPRSGPLAAGGASNFARTGETITTLEARVDAALSSPGSATPPLGPNGLPNFAESSPVL